MADDKTRIDRRRFSLGLAGASLALTRPTSLGAQEAKKKADATHTVKPWNPQPEKKRRWQIYEEEYFTQPQLHSQRSKAARTFVRVARGNSRIGRSLRSIARVEQGLHAPHHA